MTDGPAAEPVGQERTWTVSERRDDAWRNEGRGRGASMPEAAPGAAPRRRNILFITTDQQRYDSLGCNGGTVARTPGRRPPGRRGHQLPAGLQPEHGVHAGALDHADGPVRADARRRGQRHPPPGRRAVAWRSTCTTRRATAPRCWARPTSSPASTRTNQFEENARVARGDTGPWRGFERSEQAMHAAAWGNHPIAHYGRWLKANHPEHLHSFAGLLQAEPGGDTGAPGDEEQPDPARVVPHRLGGRPDRRLARLARRRRAAGSAGCRFPDPHHPWDPPASELRPGALARPRPAAGPPRLRRRHPRRPGAQAGALARLLGRHASPTWRAARPPSSPRRSPTTRSARSTPRCT